MVCAFKLTCRKNQDVTVYMESDCQQRQTKKLLSSAGGVAIQVVMLGRLHYLSTVHAKLAPAEALLQLYLERGAAVFQSLEGEFGFILIDHKRKRIYAGRDLNGSWPLYWSRKADELCVSTQLQSVCGTKELSDEYLGEYLASTGPVAEQSTPCTVYRDAFRIDPGSVRCWTFNLEESVYQIEWPKTYCPTEDLDAIAGALRERLTESVAERSQGKLGCQLSAGLDSTSIAALVAQKNPDHVPPIFATSLVYGRGELAGESPLIRLMARTHQLQLHEIDMQECLDFESSLQHIPRHDEPFPGLMRHGMSRAMIHACEQAGVHSILTGSGGDEGLDRNLDSLADLLSSARLVRLYQSLRSWSAVQNRSVLAVFWRHALYPLLATFPCRLGLCTQPLAAWGVPDWITPACRKQLQLDQRAMHRVAAHFQRPFKASLDRLARRTARGDWARWYLGAPLGINCSHPFRDPRVMDFCSQIPLRFKNVAIRKNVLRHAMRSLLPDRIRLRTKKVGFNTPFWRGLRTALPRLEEIVRDGPLPSSVEINRQRAIQKLRQAAYGAEGAESVSRLMSLISLMLWYDQPQDVAEWERLERFPIRPHSSESNVGKAPGIDDSTRPDETQELSIVS